MTEKWMPTVREGESIEDVPLSRWIGEALGAASMCWNLDGHRVSVGEFDSVEAGRIHDALMARIENAIGEAGLRGERRVVEDTIFSETGEDRITEAHNRITDESRRINKLRNLVHDLEGRIVESGSATVPGMERAIEAIADRMRLMEERMAMVEDQYVTEAGFNDLIGRVRRLETQTEFETSEDDANIRDLARRVSAGRWPTVEDWTSMTERMSQFADRLDRAGIEAHRRLTALEQDEVVMTVSDWERMGQRVNDLESQSVTVKLHTEDWVKIQHRMDGLERDIKNMREVEGARQRVHERNNDNFGKRITELEIAATNSGMHLDGGVVESPHDFSYPIGAGTGEAERVADGMADERRQRYQQGLTAGATKAIDNAERRVRQYMQRSFSQATIDDVIEALRGE